MLGHPMKLAGKTLYQEKEVDWNEGREEGVSHQQPIRDTGKDGGSQRGTLSVLSKIQCVLELYSRHKEEGGSDRPY